MSLAPSHNTAPSPRHPRWLRGAVSTLGVPFAWLGRFCGRFLRRFRKAERYSKGLVIVLPGIESQSFLNHSVAWGLSDGGWPGAIEIYDWTTTWTVFFLYHLRGRQRNLRQGRLIAERIVQYQAEYPGRPVHLIGHSGGGALSVFALEALPSGQHITSAILLAPALSPGYALHSALAHTDAGIWNFWSPLDLLFLGAGTLLFGTIDGKLSLSSGMIGFREPAGIDERQRQQYQQKLHQVPYRAGMATTFHLGGHFGCTNRAFVECQVAPLLCCNKLCSDKVVRDKLGVVKLGSDQ